MAYPNWFYFISIASIIIYSQRIQCELTKCCPDDFVLETANMSCTKNKTNWDAYNIAASQMPMCEHKMIDVFKSENYIELNGCIDKNLNSEFVAISCPNDPKTEVHLMNKCCEIGKSYDHTQRSCIKNPNTHVHFKNIFKNSAVVFQTTVPNCSDDEVFVEYYSTVNDIKFSKNEINVNDTILSTDKMCIEDLVNVELSETRANEQHIIVRSCRPTSICRDIPCIRRCCKTDQILERNPRRCEPHPNNTNLVPIFYELKFPIDSNIQTKTDLKEYGVMHSLECKIMYPLNRNKNDALHYLHTDGSIYVNNKEPYDQNNYCIENIYNKNRTIQADTFICLDGKQYVAPSKFAFYPYGLSISCVFLASTLIVYLLVPKLLNLHGKTLVSYVTSFLAAYTLLAVLQFNTSFVRSGSWACSAIAFFLLYTLIASFCWQTVMCFDIWLTFGSLRSAFAMRHNQKHNLQFLCYSAYAWIMPLIWVSFTWYANKYKPFSRKNWNPNVGDTCFFADDINWGSHLIFFILPCGIHVIANSVLFIITAINCSRVKSEIHRMQYTRDDETITSTKRKKFLISRAIFMMNLKLFTVMGISWMLEFITIFFKKSKTLEYCLDAYNIFIGVFIFFIFVFKRKVLRELQIRFGFQPTNMGTYRSTTVTNTANVSMRDIRSTSEKNLPMITASSTMLQVPNVRI